MRSSSLFYVSDHLPAEPRQCWLSTPCTTCTPSFTIFKKKKKKKKERINRNSSLRGVPCGTQKSYPSDSAIPLAHSLNIIRFSEV